MAARRPEMPTIDEYEMLDLALRRASQENLDHVPPGKPVAAAATRHGPGPDDFTFHKTRAALFIKHQDFVPGKIQRGGALGHPVYQPFSSLVDKANSWLKANPGKIIISCELLDSPLRDPEKVEDVVTSTTVIDAFDQEDTYVYHSRKLRLWYSMYPVSSSHVEQLGYRFVIPSAMNISKDVHKTQYEAFSCALASHNTNSKLRPLGGSVINMQTVRCKVHSKNNMPLPEETLWRQGRQKDAYFLHVLLIFNRTQKGQTLSQELCYRDFIPSFTESGYSSFNQLTLNVKNWRSREVGIQVLNIQSIECKTADYKLQPDTDCSFFREVGDGPTHYVTILRVYYVKMASFPAEIMATEPQDRSVTCRKFSPCMLRSPDCFGRAVYETSPQIRERMAAWVRATGAGVISVETAPFITRSGELFFQPEVTYRRCRNPGAFQVVQVYCVHLCDKFEEPRSDKLPPLPELKTSYCCTIS